MYIKSKNFKLKTQQGFTLIEILIVVAIIALLASIVLVGLGTFKGRGRDARRISDLHEVQNALELYYTKFQHYPQVSDWSSLSSLLIDSQNTGIGVYNVPNDPSAPAKTYYYWTDQQQQSYILRADLDDSQNPALSGSFHGPMPSGVSWNCNSPAYCVRF